MDYSHTSDATLQIVGFILVTLGSILSSAGGIGGGGIVSGVMLVIFKFKWQTAVVLSLTAVAGNTLAQVLMNIRKRHPNKESRPLIY